MNFGQLLSFRLNRQIKEIVVPTEEKIQRLQHSILENNGTLIEDFENASAWVPWDAAKDIIKADISKLVLSTTASIGVCSAQKPITLNLTNMKTFKLHIKASGVQSISITFSSDTWFATSIGKTFTDIPDGENTIVWHIDDMTNNSQDISIISRMMLRIYGYGGKDANVELYSLVTNYQPKPRVLIMLDDCDATAYTKAYTYMSSKGLKGTLYCIPPNIGLTGFMSEAQLNEVYANGWDIGNHTYTHPTLTTLTVAEIKQEISRCTDWLNSRGFTRASKHIAYPGGSANDNVYTAMKDLGMKTGRLIGRITNTYHYPPELYDRLIATLELKNTTTLANVKAAIDNALKLGATIIIFGHKIADTPPSDYFVATSVFNGIVDYIAFNKIACPTISEWYDNLVI